MKFLGMNELKQVGFTEVDNLPLWSCECAVLHHDHIIVFDVLYACDDYGCHNFVMAVMESRENGAYGLPKYAMYYNEKGIDLAVGDIDFLDVLEYIDM